ncbi:MAG: hypothetical protein JWR60_1452 [Polaromonas sp.]|nr:hypothetical protein [Polaromonas sp.]
MRWLGNRFLITAGVFCQASTMIWCGKTVKRNARQHASCLSAGVAPDSFAVMDGDLPVVVDRQCQVHFPTSL